MTGEQYGTPFIRGVLPPSPPFFFFFSSFFFFFLPPLVSSSLLQLGRLHLVLQWDCYVYDLNHWLCAGIAFAQAWRQMKQDTRSTWTLSPSPPPPTCRDTQLLRHIYHRRRQYVPMGENIWRKTRHIVIIAGDNSTVNINIIILLPATICLATKYAATHCKSLLSVG